MRQAAFFSDNILSEKTSRLRRKEETSLYKIILCGYLRFIELTLKIVQSLNCQINCKS